MIHLARRQAKQQKFHRGDIVYVTWDKDKTPLAVSGCVKLNGVFQYTLEPNQDTLIVFDRWAFNAENLWVEHQLAFVFE